MNDNERPEPNGAFLLELIGSLMARLIETGTLTHEDAVEIEHRAVAEMARTISPC